MNGCIYKGPDLLNPLLAVLRRFRKNPMAAVGDIKKRLPYIVISPEHQDVQRFLWLGMYRRSSPKVFKIFGAASSPASANYVKMRNAKEYRDKFPRVYEAIMKNTYMDDNVDGEVTSKISELFWSPFEQNCGQVEMLI
ncbi:unnamed protein product [Allacma fusca]|uniref:Uncharacterized protein n=1 Tax=Allacma fusca TaxID=39272 RepID=A0A8J2KU05_9HEXA|nr:unnamed protein product [Allacma fusca]